MGEVRVLVTFAKKSCFFFCYVIKKCYFCKVICYPKFAILENFFENDLQKVNKNRLRIIDYNYK